MKETHQKKMLGTSVWFNLCEVCSVVKLMETESMNGDYQGSEKEMEWGTSVQWESISVWGR